MRQGLAPTGPWGRAMAAAYLALLAEAYGKVGQVEEGLSVLAEALAAGGQNWGAFLRGGAVSAERRTAPQSSASIRVNGKSKAKQTSKVKRTK